jgi:hypothetical protein
VIYSIHYIMQINGPAFRDEAKESKESRKKAMTWERK